jgi:Txe/YoeB family toxin of Txe-Axe toxin-antitoxin module
LVKILVRADSGFCRDALMSWCEANEVKYLFGMAKNRRLLKRITHTMKKARRDWAYSGRAARRFMQFSYRTRNSWSRARRVVGKAEYMDKGENPRFVVTNLSPQEYEAQELYEKLYCARGEMENRIKEQQLYLFADRTSSATMRANQLRLWFSSLAYVILNELRSVGLRGTRMAEATCQSIRLKLLKIGAHVKVSVRRVVFSMASGYPDQDLFRSVLSNLQRTYRLKC